jgi:alpha-glucosidase
MQNADWRTAFPWWQRGIIYQIYPRSFQDSDGDGVGDLKGILARLDYLAWLGVDAIWLSPIYPSPMVDFGYDVADYTNIDPLFGDLATFDELVARAHERGIGIIMDYVANHSSDQHPWFQESRASRDNPRRDWYTWADPRPDGAPPNNWLSHWGGSAWEWDATTGQYYLHSFHTTMPDLNWRNPAVKDAMLDVVRFWLERGVDGFRIDAAHQIMKDPELRDNPPNPDYRPGASPAGRAYWAQLHLYDRDHPDTHVILRELRQVLDAYSAERPRVACAETRVYDWPKWAAYYGTGLDELHVPFNFGLTRIAWTASAVREVVRAIEASVPSGAWPNYVLGTHDDARLATRIGVPQARVALMLQLTLRGTPTLYYGDELGMHDVAIPPERARDPFEQRDAERTPMQWDGSPNAGFCPLAVEPWLPIASDYPAINVASERADSHSMLALTRALLALRRAAPALAVGSYDPIESAPDACFAYLRQFGDERWLIALNFAGTEQALRLPGMGSGRVALSTQLDRAEDVNLATLHLRGNEGCVVKVGA